MRIPEGTMHVVSVPADHRESGSTREPIAASNGIVPVDRKEQDDPAILVHTTGAAEAAREATAAEAGLVGVEEEDLGVAVADVEQWGNTQRR
jgi:hypothetical protein